MNDFSKKLVHPAKKARGLARQQRVIAAGLKLLKDHTLESLTMAQIAKEADCSVGNLYKRFANKDALLTVLLASVQDDLHKEFEAVFDAKTAGGEGLQGAVKPIVKFLVNLFARRGNLLRAIVMRQMNQPEVTHSLRAMRYEMMDQTYAVIAPLMIATLTAEEKRRRFEIFWQLIIGSLLEMLLNKAGPLHIDDADIVENLTRIAMANLVEDCYQS